MAGRIIFEGKAATELELALFVALRQGPLDAGSLATRLLLRPDRARALFDALAADGLLVRHGDRYANTEAVDSLLQQMCEDAPAGRAGLLPAVVSALLVLLAGCTLLWLWAVRPAPPVAARAGQAVETGGFDPLRALLVVDGKGDRLLFRDPTNPPEGGATPLLFVVSTRAQADAVTPGKLSRGVLPRPTEVVATQVEQAAVWARVATPDIWIVAAVASPDEERRLRALVDGNNSLRAVSGLPPVQIVDLRSIFDQPELQQSKLPAGTPAKLVP